MSKESSKKYKLFPRNLTARADGIVHGNPVVSRPEDGVENCFPGLEFDHRNLDKVFFPGLVFELHHPRAVILRAYDPSGVAANLLSPRDIENGIFLVFVQGVSPSRVLGEAPRSRTFRLLSPSGLESWRVIRDLEPGNIAIVLCDEQTLNRIESAGFGVDDVAGNEGLLTRQEDLKARKDTIVMVPGIGDLIFLFGERASYLTGEGVLDPELVLPGDLTRSLCSPWQYDFADCGCFYWASNKPDLVASEAQPQQILNFQRKDRSEAGDAATEPTDWILKQDYRWDGDANIMRHAEMITRWTELPFVINGRETKGYRQRRLQPPQRVLSRQEIVERLTVLAPVEHALAVEYLYAFYSLARVDVRSPSIDADVERIGAAGEEVFRVAIDEMRHFRWVNEILIELGHPWILKRASVIGEDIDGDGRALNRPFSLLPLTRDQIDWFIDVERASQDHMEGDEDTIDGLYTLILSSIENGTEFSKQEKSHYGHLIKIIIDEGMDHFRRFSRAKSMLAGLPESRYLLVSNSPERLPEDTDDRILQDTVDLAYTVVLRSLDYVFSLGDLQRGALMEAARRAMYNMDDACKSLATRGVGAMFDLSSYQPRIAEAAGGQLLDSSIDSLARATEVGAPLREALTRLGESSRVEDQELARRMARRLEDMTQHFVDLSAED